MLLDGVDNHLAVLDVLLGQNGQHVDQRLAVVRQIHQTGQVLLGELLVFLVGGGGGGGCLSGDSTIGGGGGGNVVCSWIHCDDSMTLRV